MSARAVNGLICFVCGGKKAAGRSRCLACNADPTRMAHHERRRVALALKWKWCPVCAYDNPDHAPGCKVAEAIEAIKNPTAQQEHNDLVDAGLRHAGPHGSRSLPDYELGHGDDYTGRGHR